MPRFLIDPPPSPPSAPYPPRLNGVELKDVFQLGARGRILLGRAHGKAPFRGYAFFPCGCIVFILPPAPIKEKVRISIKYHYIFFLDCWGRIEKQSAPIRPLKLIFSCIVAIILSFRSAPNNPRNNKNEYY